MTYKVSGLANLRLKIGNLNGVDDFMLYAVVSINQLLYYTPIYLFSSEESFPKPTQTRLLQAKNKIRELLILHLRHFNNMSMSIVYFHNSLKRSD